MRERGLVPSQGKMSVGLNTLLFGVQGAFLRTVFAGFNVRGIAAWCCLLPHENLVLLAFCHTVSLFLYGKCTILSVERL